jgi:branched-chain amino acid transport system substrate-binding protein
VRYAALQHKLDVADVVEARGDPSGYPSLARKLAQEHPDAVIYTGLGDPRAGALLAALDRALPGVPLYGSSALATGQPIPPGIPSTAVVKPALPATSYPPGGRRVLARLRRSGKPALPEALYGYESMTLILDALDAAGSDSDDRPVVARAALAPRVRRSVLGAYRVLPGGDVSTSRFGAYRLCGDGLDYIGLRGPDATLR